MIKIEKIGKKLRKLKKIIFEPSHFHFLSLKVSITANKYAGFYFK